MTNRVPEGMAWKLQTPVALPENNMLQTSSKGCAPFIIANGVGLFWPSGGLVTLTLPPAARLTVGVLAR
jgi:hypothetical protein